AKLVGKSRGIWAGGGVCPAATELSRAMGEPLSLKAVKGDGEPFKPGDVLITLKGPARTLLALERPLINLAAYVSGIATRTNGLVAIVRKNCPKRTPRVIPTRKTLPGYRDLAVFGVIAGGGHPHR